MPDFPVLSPALQLGFYQRLQDAQEDYLLPALLEQVGQLDIGQLDGEPVVRDAFPLRGTCRVATGK